MGYELVFVSGTTRVDRPYYDPSTRYRAFNIAEHFRRKGKRVCLISQAKFDKNSDAFTRARLILFHRPQATESLMRYVVSNNDKQKLIADYDDLVFDVTAVRETPAVHDRGENVRNVSRLLAANAEIGSMFRFHSSSTVPLAVAMDSILGSQAVVIHNALDKIYREIARGIYLSRKNSKPKYSVGYFSGTASHNHDLEMIAPYIADHLAKSAKNKLLLVGPVGIPAHLKPYISQITKNDITGFYNMPLQIAECRKILGPLVKNRFSVCKSGLKFFEAAAVGATVAATPIPDIARFDSPLLLKCTNPEDWGKALNRSDLPEDLQEESVMNLLDGGNLEQQIDIWTKAFLE